MFDNRLTVFVATLGTGAAIFLTLMDWSALASLELSDVVGLLTFVGLAALAQVLAVDSAVGTARPVKSSIAFLPMLALAVLFPPPVVAVAAGGMSAVTELFVRKDRVWSRAIFNTSQITLAYGFGAWLFQALHGSLGTTPSFDGSHLTHLFLTFYGLALVFFGLNICFVGGYIAIRDGHKFSEVLNETAGRGGGNLFYDLLASPLALGVAYLYFHLHVAGLILAVLPFLLIRHTYISAIHLHKANKDLLRVLIKAIETRDPYTSGHSLRVSNLARLIAEDLGLRPSQVDKIERAALLHDIGKIEALYSEIIAKESSLTEHEKALIKTHATKGADLLQTLTSLEQEVIAGVRHHHEQYDGSGYPDGLAGKAIPLAARIIMLCDSVDAMLSDRPYRQALSLPAVRQELLRCAGSQFDPDLVESVLANNTLERAGTLVTRAGARAPQRAVAV